MGRIFAGHTENCHIPEIHTEISLKRNNTRLEKKTALKMHFNELMCLAFDTYCRLFACCAIHLICISAGSGSGRKKLMERTCTRTEQPSWQLIFYSIGFTTTPIDWIWIGDDAKKRYSEWMGLRRCGSWKCAKRLTYLHLHLHIMIVPIRLLDNNNNHWICEFCAQQSTAHLIPKIIVIKNIKFSMYNPSRIGHAHACHQNWWPSLRPTEWMMRE